MGGALSPHFHKLCAHRLHAVFFISVTFNKIMAMEEIKLTQNVHNEALSADISGMVQTLSWTLKRQKPGGRKTTAREESAWRPLHLKIKIWIK